MSHGHGICMSNNPNCGIGVRGCNQEHDMDEDEVNDKLNEEISNYFNGFPNDSMTLMDHIEDAIDSCTNDLKGYENHYCDNELFNALLTISDLVAVPKELK